MFDVPEEFWSLLPQAYSTFLSLEQPMYRDLILFIGISGHSLSNTVYGQYYRPTVETMFNKYCSLLHDHAALRTFVQEQQEIASKMMQVSRTGMYTSRPDDRNSSLPGSMVRSWWLGRRRMKSI